MKLKENPRWEWICPECLATLPFNNEVKPPRCPHGCDSPPTVYQQEARKP